MLLMQHAKLAAEAETLLPASDILFGSEGQAFQKLNGDSLLARRVRKDLLTLESKHKGRIGIDEAGVVLRWELSGSRFAEAYEHLRLSEMQKLERQIESTVHEYLYSQSCASRLGDRPGDLKKVRKEIQRHRAKVESALTRLNRWRLKYTSNPLRVEADADGEPSPEDEAPNSAAPPLGEEWGSDGIFRGDSSWLDSEGGDARPHGGSLGLRLKRRLVVAREDEARALEEKALLEKEMERTLETYKNQLQCLREKMETLEKEIHAEIGPSLMSSNCKVHRCCSIEST